MSYTDKRLLKTALAAVTAVGISDTISSHAFAADAIGTANANIIAPISIVADLTLEFGQIITGTVASEVTVDTAGTRTFDTGDAADGGGTVRAAQFTATGEPSTAFDITLPVDDFVKLTGPGLDMNLKTWTDSSGGSDTLDAGGNFTFTVGATVTIGATQTSGPYTAPFTVTVNYQ